MSSANRRIKLELCLHPICHRLGVQACVRGLCCECYRVLMRALKNPNNRLSEEQLIIDGRILPRGTKEYHHAEMEYGERLDWFLEGHNQSTTGMSDDEVERRMWSRFNSALSNVGRR